MDAAGGALEEQEAARYAAHARGNYTPPPPCDSSLLTQGTDLAGAQLELNINGAFFEELEFLPAVQ